MKKKLPLALVQGFKPEFGDEVTFEFGSDQFIVVFKDIDPNSDFYFKIIETNSTGKLRVSIRPSNNNSVSTLDYTLTIAEANSHFGQWIETIKAYNSNKTIFDDPISQGFKDEILGTFQFTDHETANKPLPVDAILFLDSHLDKIESEIETIADQQHLSDANEIKALASSIRKELTNKSRRYILERCINLWARLVKLGPKYIKQFFVEGGKIAFKESVKFLLEKGFQALG